MSMSTTNVTIFYHPVAQAVIKGETQGVVMIAGLMYAIIKWYDPGLKCFVESRVRHINVLDVEEVEAK